jgi:hypothetical protein
MTRRPIQTATIISAIMTKPMEGCPSCAHRAGPMVTITRQSAVAHIDRICTTSRSKVSRCGDLNAVFRIAESWRILSVVSPGGKARSRPSRGPATRAAGVITCSPPIRDHNISSEASVAARPALGPRTHLPTSRGRSTRRGTCLLNQRAARLLVSRVGGSGAARGGADRRADVAVRALAVL